MPWSRCREYEHGCLAGLARDLVISTLTSMENALVSGLYHGDHDPVGISDGVPPPGTRGVAVSLLPMPCVQEMIFFQIYNSTSGKILLKHYLPGILNHIVARGFLTGS